MPEPIHSPAGALAACPFACRLLANNELATLPPGLFATGSALLRGANVALGGNPLEDSAEPVPSTFRVDDATVSCARAASHLPPSPRPR